MSHRVPTLTGLRHSKPVTNTSLGEVDADEPVSLASLVEYEVFGKQANVLYVSLSKITKLLSSNELDIEDFVQLEHLFAYAGENQRHKASLVALERTRYKSLDRGVYMLVLRVLARYGEITGDRNSSITPQLAHEDISHIIGTPRESVTQAFKPLLKEGIVEVLGTTHSRKYIIHLDKVDDDLLLHNDDVLPFEPLVLR